MGRLSASLLRAALCGALCSAVGACGDDDAAGDCEAFDWGAMAQTTGEQSGVTGRPLSPSGIGRIAGCEDDAQLGHDGTVGVDAAACDDPDDLSGCFNPFAEHDAGSFDARIRAQFGPCACDMTPTGSLSEGGGYLRAAD